MAAEMLSPWIVGAPALAGVAAMCLPSQARNAAAALAAGACLAVLAITITLVGAIEATGPVRQSLNWAPSLGLAITFRIDGLAWLFVVLIAAIGVLIAGYARGYMPADEPTPRFFAYLLGFTASMLGVVTSGNLLQLVVCWELTALFSFLLIGFWYGSQSARSAARQALLTTALGGLCLLAGVLVLGHIVGSYDLDAVLAAGPRLTAHALAPLALVAMLIGAFTKSAQFPFDSWLPRAMAAPTPVSAFLHSATLVKAGVFLLARFWTVFSGTDLWVWLVSGVGLTTMLLGAWRATRQDDIKALLAHSTLSHLGLITLLLGLGAPLAAFTAIFHLVNHAMFKAALFMTAGAVEHQTGTRSLAALGGLGRAMPVTAAVTLVAAGAMAGVPLLSGFVSKEMFFAQVAEAGGGNAAFVLAATAAGALSVTYALRLFASVFLGKTSAAAKQAHEAPALLWGPPGVLAAGCLLVGVAPAFFMGRALDLAAGDLLGGATSASKLVLWHGFGLPLAMSAAALLAGGAMWWAGRGWRAAPGAQSGRPLAERFAALTLALEDMVAPARLQRHVLMIFLGVLLAVGVSTRWSGWDLRPPREPPDFAFALLWAAGMACAIGAAVFARARRVAGVVLTGGAGLVTAVTFTWFSAPDLAITQLLVEIVTTILLLLGLRWLPLEDRARHAARSGGFVRGRDALIAATLGLGASFLAYGVMTYPTPAAISRYFLEHAYAGAGGRNAVNVILVDFRGFDTLGEITVVAVVALSVVALLRGFRPAAEAVRPMPAQESQSEARRASAKRVMLVPGLIIQLMFPMIVLFGLHLFLRGHDLPGGGFAGGVTISAAILLLYMALGVRKAEARLRIAPGRWIALGLLLATLTGVGAMLFGQPFLTSAFSYLKLGELPPAPMASALIFDLGVMLLVIGATSAMLVAIAHQSQRRPRGERDGEAK
ncbi:cation:proton antiporter [Phenylobacterium sp. Root77]|jgi:multicomponent K+:H+ antiporter subunit A|uniref:hydrogen gas-evolving membrane-bound hydrogenase subunit E n=1 Tax=unclassified Phenylobacterium TaxID=2640670 RepID=UPI0006F8EC13|nr:MULTISPECIES: hydrogen gas-evolving membrane-bound hydrogenase subunit E [unclassified Phenylobacterium]KQW66967.1 cation:proton antiporter [Phenylobacterium sp. Root1277]KQW89660.1 cation:proton antiporter [Phenylobacterium sp. Root1290]KRC43471.1 cation:proton antiporter [Phenylobacterium sp. Root77]